MTWTAPGQLTLLADPIDERFLAFHHQHPDVYVELVRLARRWKAAGHPKIGMKMLFEVLRWNRGLSQVRDDRGFKLNNDFSSRYARLIQANEPDLRGFFETRALADERGAA